MAVILALHLPTGERLSHAQSSDEIKTLREEIDRLREAQRAILQELESIRALLRGRGARSPDVPEDISLSVEGHPERGLKSAKLILVEFSDYQCPFCARFFHQTFPRIHEEYIKTKRVRYVFRDFPIQSIHPQATKAAEAAHCAEDQGKYWEMHDRLFANQKAMTMGDLMTHAQTLTLDLPMFQACLHGGKYTDRVQQDLAEGRRAGVRGTPTFFLGTPETTSMKPVAVIRGAQPYARFKETLERLLSDLQSEKSQ